MKRAYEWTDTNAAMYSALLSLARMVHLYGAEETACAEAAEILRNMKVRAEDTAWLTDALHQMCIDFDQIQVNGRLAQPKPLAEGGAP